MRLSKLDAAAHLGVSPATIDRRIQRGDLKAEKEPHGTRYKVWVILEDEPTAESADESPVESPDRSLAKAPTGSDQPTAESHDSAPPPSDRSAYVEMAKLREQLKNAEGRANSLEELANYHKQHLSDAEWRYQEILQELRQSQQNVAALTRALPPPRLDPAEEDPEATTIVEAAGSNPATRRRRRWWPFGRG